jgi:thioredoxin-dependent peroxiredoxin
MVEEGKPAPDFEMKADDGSTVKLSDLRGKNVVLFFYPKDDTPGCTVEACEFRDAFPRFQAIDAEVFGVSPDSVESHVKFRRKFDLPYRLLADDEHAVAEKYGVWGEKKFMGKTYMGVARTTFVIGKDGKVAKVFGKVKPDGHADEVGEVVSLLD